MDNNQPITTKPTTEQSGILLFSPCTVSADEFSEIRTEFDKALLGGTADPLDIFAVLYKYFNENNFNAVLIEKYADNFWDLFVRVSWHTIQSLKVPIFANVVAHTLSFATSLPIDMKNQIIAYLSLRTPAEARVIHEQVKKKIMSLDMPFFFSEEGKKITLSQVVKRLGVRVEDMDLSKFEMLPGIQKAIFPGGDALVSAGDKKYQIKKVMELIDVLSFFARGADHIQDYITDYYNSIDDRSQMELDDDSLALLGANILRLKAEQEARESFKSIKVEQKISLPGESDGNFVGELPKQKNNFSKWIAEPPTLRSLLSWLKETEDKTEARKKLEELFRRELGDSALADMETALALVGLDEFLNKNNYPGDDLVHYDENSGGFKWGA